MYMKDVRNALGEMLQRAEQDKIAALSLYATAVHLIDWMYEQAVYAGVEELENIGDKLADVRQGFRFCCGLLPGEEAGASPVGDARAALSVILNEAFIGADPDLIANNLEDIYLDAGEEEDDDGGEEYEDEEDDDEEDEDDDEDDEDFEEDRD